MKQADRHKYPPFSIRLPEDDLEWLKTYADEIGSTPNAIIKRAISEYRNAISATATRATATDASENNL